MAGRTQLLSSVTNAARILKEFGKGDTQLGVSQLARRCEVSKSTAHRLVATLVAEGLLEKVEDTGLFRLTNTMRSIGLSAETAQTLHQASTSALDQLRKHTDATLHVAILDGVEVIYVERRESPNAMQVFRRVGARGPVHSTSTGKCLLAYLTPEEQQELLNQVRLVRRTPYTITSKNALLQELVKIRRQGFAENRFESELGICSIAAPVRDRNGRVVAAVSVAAMVAERDVTLAPLARPLIEAASRISHALGWRG
jgi:IclR family transcriptional regulator, KDG regulon repressor